jgi:hypothetical protein
VKISFRVKQLGTDAERGRIRFKTTCLENEQGKITDDQSPLAYLLRFIHPALSTRKPPHNEIAADFAAVLIQTLYGTCKVDLLQL